MSKDQLYDSLIANPFGFPNSEQRKAEALEQQAEAEKKGENVTSLSKTFKGTTVLMNSLFIGLAFIVTICLIYLVILCRKVMQTRCCKTFVKVMNSIERKLMFNSLLRAALETYLSLTIQMWYGWRSLRIDAGSDDRIEFLILLAMTIYCIGLPFTQHNFLWRNRNIVFRQSFQQSYGSLIQNISLLRVQSLAFSLVFLLRRLMFAYTICNIDINITFQVMAIDALSTSMLCYFICNRPMADGVNNFI